MYKVRKRRKNELCNFSINFRERTLESPTLDKFHGTLVLTIVMEVNFISDKYESEVHYTLSDNKKSNISNFVCSNFPSFDNVLRKDTFSIIIYYYCRLVEGFCENLPE